ASLPWLQRAIRGRWEVPPSPVTPGSFQWPPVNIQGRPLSESNLGGSIGRHGLSAPGENITSLGTNGKPQTFGGTSAAAPFVTGAIALLWSEFPDASAAKMKVAITRCGRQSRNTLVPAVLDAGAAHQVMVSAHKRRKRP